MGGVFAVLPAYEADLYGAKYIGAIHGRFLTFAAAATVLGPTLLLNLKKMAETEAINGIQLSAFWEWSMIRKIVETDRAFNRWSKYFSQTCWPRLILKCSAPSLVADWKGLKALLRPRLSLSQSWWPLCLLALLIQGESWSRLYSMSALQLCSLA